MKPRLLEKLKNTNRSGASLRRLSVREESLLDKRGLGDPRAERSDDRFPGALHITVLIGTICGDRHRGNSSNPLNNKTKSSCCLNSSVTSHYTSLSDSPAPFFQFLVHSFDPPLPGVDRAEQYANE